MLAHDLCRDLCSKLRSITDTVMYRNDEDQSLCFAEMFHQYIDNATNATWPVTQKAALNRHLSGMK